MYVAGELSDVDNVLVDIGTGYYVEKVSSLYHNVTFPLPCTSFSMNN